MQSSNDADPKHAWTVGFGVPGVLVIGVAACSMLGIADVATSSLVLAQAFTFLSKWALGLIVGTALTFVALKLLIIGVAGVFLRRRVLRLVPAILIEAASIRRRSSLAMRSRPSISAS